jgi:hypothetical protein
MQSVPIDLKKSEEIADWATDKGPGDRVALYGTIKSKDDQTMVVTVDEVDDGPDDEDDDHPEGGNEGSDAAPVGSPPGSMGALSDDTAI